MSIFDGIDLPAEEKQKPADIPADDRADEEAKNSQADQDKPEEKPDNKPDDQADAPDVPDDSTKPDAEEKDEADQKPTEEPAKDEAEDKPEAKPDLPPFHEHPDWKKMVDRVKLAEERAAEAERKATEAAAATRANPEYEGLSAAQIATKEVEKKAAAGWKPKDQLEVSEAYATALEKAQEYLAAQKKSKDDESAQAANKVQEQVESKFEELGISDKDEQKKVRDLVVGWANSGANITLDTFDVAAQQLRIKGEIGKKLPEKPEQTEGSKQAEAKRQQEKAEANRRLAKKKPDGESARTKVNYDYLHKNDLDTILQDQLGQMG